MNNPPNILMITAHDIGRHLGCYGVPQAGTPHLDALAADGVRFANFYSTAPQCSPARASLATGRYPHANGVLGICSPVFGFDLAAGEYPLVRHLKDAGYTTGRIGIVHETMSPESLPYDFVGTGGGIQAIVPQAVSYFRSRAAGGPFFLQIGTREAHRPFHMQYQEYGVYVPPWLKDTPEAGLELAAFQGSIHAFDAGVGVILRGLEEAGLRDNTLVMVFSDHGIPFPRAKHSLYEPGCTVTAIFRWPERGWCGGRVVESLLSGVDLLPTILAALGTELSSSETPAAAVAAVGTAGPASIHGRSFLPLLDGDEYRERQAVFTEQNFNAWTDTSRALRTRRYKLIANFSPGRGFFDSSQAWRPATEVHFIQDAARSYHPPFELFDLDQDPLEITNLADEPGHRRIALDLKKRLWTWMHETDDPLLQGPPIPPIYHRTMEGLAEAGAKAGKEGGEGS